jgi:hypothetical protein
MAATTIEERPALALTEEEWVLANPKRLHAGGFPLVDSYPSQCAPPHLPPEPMLLDTCTIQHMAWARRNLPDGSQTARETCERVQKRVGVALAVELTALMDLERMACDDLPFCVSLTSRYELSAAPAARRQALLAEWDDWAEHAQSVVELSADVVETLVGNAAPAPVHPDQLAIPGVLKQRAVLGPFGGAGDCALIRDALRAEIPVILTTDLRTFWRHRIWLYERGVEVWRPSDVRQAYMNYSLMPSSPVYPPVD